MARHPREEKRWFEFKDKLMRQRVLDWLASENIEPIIAPPIELWPQLIARVPIRQDVKQGLITLLSKGK